MPRITLASNGSVVRPTVTNAKVQNNMAAFEAEIKSQGQIGAALGNVAKVYMEKEQEKDNVRRLELDNQIADFKNQLELKYRNENQLGQAEGVAERYHQELKSGITELIGQSKIKYRPTMEMATLSAMNTTTTSMNVMRTHEVKELESNKSLVLETSFQNTDNEMVNPDVTIADVVGLRNKDAENIRMLYGNKGEEFVTQAIRNRDIALTGKYLSKILEPSPVDGQVDFDKFTASVEGFQKLGLIDEVTASGYLDKVAGAKEAQFISNTVNSLLDGVGSLGEAEKRLADSDLTQAQKGKIHPVLVKTYKKNKKIADYKKAETEDKAFDYLAAELGRRTFPSEAERDSFIRNAVIGLGLPPDSTKTVLDRSRGLVEALNAKHDDPDAEVRIKNGLTDGTLTRSDLEQMAAKGLITMETYNNSVVALGTSENSGKGKQRKEFAAAAKLWFESKGLKGKDLDRAVFLINDDDSLGSLDDVYKRADDVFEKKNYKADNFIPHERLRAGKEQDLKTRVGGPVVEQIKSSVDSMVPAERNGALWNKDTKANVVERIAQKTFSAFDNRDTYQDAMGRFTEMNRRLGVEIADEDTFYTKFEEFASAIYPDDFRGYREATKREFTFEGAYELEEQPKSRWESLDKSPQEIIDEAHPRSGE
jgi:hypothetical protein